MPSYTTHLQQHQHQHQHHRNASPSRSINGARDMSGYINPLKRVRTPDVNDNASTSSSVHAASADDRAAGEGAAAAHAADERKRARLHDLYQRSNRMLANLFKESPVLSITQQPVHPTDPIITTTKPSPSNHGITGGSKPSQANGLRPTPTPRKRKIDEDDYGDEEDDEEEDDEEEERPELTSPLAARKPSAPPISRPNGILFPPLSNTRHGTPSSISATDRKSHNTLGDAGKSSEEARKRLEEEKKAAEDAAKESFQTLFYTLENDSDAMVEQQKLDELDRQVETEMSSGGGTGAGHSGSAPRQGTLSSTNLGASSLTLKHLIARIDAQRNMVKASDANLRSLMSEVRKNRSKWASEDKVGQEELYESAERVLMELKAMTEWAGPFLQKVNKREAPDYYTIIKHPMDIGTMIKKLKQLQYKSKKDFVADLDLIWANCLKYNAEPNHFLRKKAEHMKKETARLTPLIPEITVRDRAEVEAEERRLHQEFENDEDSDDEEPIIATRGRKAPKKSSMKGTSNSRKAVPAAEDQAKADPLSLFKNEHMRTEGEPEGSQTGFSTPPPSGTPLRLNGTEGGSSHPADTSEIDGPTTAIGQGLHDEVIQEDEEYRTWKQVTKKDRAHAAAERHKLFKGDRINPDEPALLRSKGAMRRWLRQQKLEPEEKARIVGDLNITEKEGEQVDQGATLAEGMDNEEDSTLPDYYYPMAGMPFVNEKLAWREDSEGHIVDRQEECIRIVPSTFFSAPIGNLASKVDSNIKQMQETRKVAAKITIVKQMQVQAQTYQNQFQKYDPEPFNEVDMGPTVASIDGPIMAPFVCRAALQRCVGKIFYHAGFEDFQPAAIEAMTDIAGEYFVNLTRTLNLYHDAPKVYDADPVELANISKSIVPAPSTLGSNSLGADKVGPKLVPRFTIEEQILHTLQECGLDLDALETYVTDEVGRLSSKLEVHHSRMRDHLAELLRPALDPSVAGADGVGAFNDGSEQFVGGDFAEDIDEDFFGFKELGLDKEFGFSSLSVPLHLLQSRVHNAYQPANAVVTTTIGPVMETPDAYPAMTLAHLEEQIGLVKDFFRKKLEASENEALIEDDELPAKQRFPKPRLPPTGKISSPRKRPIREQQMMARKKRRLEIEAGREREAAEKAAAEAEAQAQAQVQADAAAAAVAETSALSVPDEEPQTVAPANAETITTDVGATATTDLDLDALTNGIFDDTNGDGEEASGAAADSAEVNGNQDEVLVNGSSTTTVTDSTAAKKSVLEKPSGKLKLDMPPPDSNAAKSGDPKKDSKTKKSGPNSASGSGASNGNKQTPGESEADKSKSLAEPVGDKSPSKEKEKEKDKAKDKGADKENDENAKEGDEFDVLNQENVPIAAH